VECAGCRSGRRGASVGASVLGALCQRLVAHTTLHFFGRKRGHRLGITALCRLRRAAPRTSSLVKRARVSARVRKIWHDLLVVNPGYTTLTEQWQSE